MPDAARLGKGKNSKSRDSARARGQDRLNLVQQSRVGAAAPFFEGLCEFTDSFGQRGRGACHHPIGFVEGELFIVEARRKIVRGNEVEVIIGKGGRSSPRGRNTAIIRGR